MPVRPPALAASLLALALASPAPALVIDNFEEGAITLLDDSDSPGATFAEQSGLASGNVLGGVRLVSATASGTLEAPGAGTATLVPLPIVDDSVLLESTSVTTFNFFYDGVANGTPQTTDGALNVNLAPFDAFRVDVPVLLGTESELRITLWDGDSGSNSLFHVATTGINIIAFSEFSGIDFSDIRAMRLAVSEVLNLNPISITNFEAVPEPGTGLLLATGLLGLAARRRSGS